MYRAIHHGTILEDVSSGVMPKWWRLSLPLNVSEAEAERIAGKLVGAVQHAPEKEELSESPSKRVKIHHCAEVKDLFLDLVAIQRERLGRNYITTFRHAQLVGPDIFGGMNVSVPKRWKCIHCAARDPESSYQQGHRLNFGSAAFGEQGAREVWVCIPAVGPEDYGPKGLVVQEICHSAESHVQRRGGG